MRVHELIEELKTVDPERLVVMSRDEEGNAYCPVIEISTGAYNRGDYGLDELTDELIEQGYCSEDVLDGTPCICLWP